MKTTPRKLFPTLIVLSLLACDLASPVVAKAGSPHEPSAARAAVLEPTPTPFPRVSEVYGTAPDGTALHWFVTEPDGAGPWPAVLVIHAGGFKTGNPGPPGVAADLAAAGYLALAIEYRLAPPGLVSNQPAHSDIASGRPPEQTDDVEMAIRAARSDPRCNGQVGAVGGSSGASHAAYVAATGVAGDDRVDVAVCLSGEYDYSDYSSLHDTRPNAGTFNFNVTNYVNTIETDYAGLYAASPVAVVTSAVAPLFIVSSDDDPMPLAQPGLMVSKLNSVGATNFEQLLIPGSLHSFKYWGQVKDPVIAFLSSRFALPPPTPSPTPTPSPSPAPVPPSIARQSGDKTVTVGQTAKFSVLAKGTAPLGYQWKKNGLEIAGATDFSYITPPTTLADNGAKFSVVVTNIAGSVTGQEKTLTVK